jgi:hypothetical protein
VPEAVGESVDLLAAASKVVVLDVRTGASIFAASPAP